MFKKFNNIIYIFISIIYLLQYRFYTLIGKIYKIFPNLNGLHNSNTRISRQKYRKKPKIIFRVYQFFSEILLQINWLASLINYNLDNFPTFKFKFYRFKIFFLENLFDNKINLFFKIKILQVFKQIHNKLLKGVKIFIILHLFFLIFCEKINHVVFHNFF